MNTSPIITKSLIDSRQRDMLAEARRARLVREAEQANRGTVAAPRQEVRRSWRLALAGLFGTR